MELLHNKSIIECDEFEELTHHKEIEKIMDAIESLKNYNVEIVQYRLDLIAKHLKPRVFDYKLHDLQDLIETFDIKNGVDVLLENEQIVFEMYGQGYKVTDEVTGNTLDDIIKTRLYILGMDTNEFVDLAQQLRSNLEIESPTMEMQ